MKKIGLVNIDTSHPFTFTQRMAENPELELNYFMVYNDGFRGDDEVEWLMNKCNMEKRAETIDELAEKCDVGFIQSCNWDNHIDQALPFIERGKTVFIDKPLVGNVKDIARVRNLMENGAKILGASSARYCFEVQNFLEQPVEERGEVVSVYAECGVDEFNYGVHVGEILSEVAGARAVSCKFNGRAERNGTKCELYTVRFENGVIGTYCTYLNGWRPFNVSIMTTKTSICFKVDTPNLYIALLTRISETLKTGESKMTDVENILNVTEFMLCGKKSRDFENGREVLISELCEDDGFDGNAFNEGYAASASILYKD